MQSLIPVYQVDSRFKREGCYIPPPSRELSRREINDIAVGLIAGSTLFHLGDIYKQVKRKVFYIKKVVKLEVALEEAEKTYWAKQGSLQNCMELQYQFFISVTKHLKIDSAAMNKAQFMQMSQKAFEERRKGPFYDPSSAEDYAGSFLEGFLSLRSQLRSWVFRTHIGSCKKRFENDPASQGAIRQMALSLEPQRAIVFA